MIPPMSTVSLRPATPDDVAQMLQIEKMSYPEPWNSTQFLEEMNKSYSRVLVLTDDETDEFVAGYIVYWVQVEGVSLHNVAVDVKWRGLGFAKKMLHAMINEAVRDEIPKVILEVRVSNTGAIHLYQQLGFIKTHERQKFYKDGEAALVMELKTSDLSTTIQ